MSAEKTTREMVYEIGRDVKWLCRTLDEVKVLVGGHEQRLRELEHWRSEKVGEEQRACRISAGTGGLVGGIVAFLLKLIGLV
jgi:hypothetical protein